MASGRLRLQSGGVGCRVVHVETRPLRQPGLELGVLVRAVVIDDVVQLQIPGHLLVNAAQKAEELLIAMPGLARTSRSPHRSPHPLQHRLGAVQDLDLASSCQRRARQCSRVD
jgi:hypothetical protein